MFFIAICKFRRTLQILFFMAVFEDLITPYLGPGFCCKVSCKFFHYEPFHKPIEGCKGYEDFVAQAPSTATYDQSFTLEYFMDFASNEKWKCYNKKCPISWSKPFHCQGDKECISHAKFCSHFNVPFMPIQTQTFETIPLFDFGTGQPEQLHENFQTKTIQNKTESSEKNVCDDHIALEVSLGDFNNEEGRFFCPFSSCSHSVEQNLNKGWANISSVLNHLNSQHKGETKFLPRHFYEQLDKTFCTHCVRLYKPNKENCQKCDAKLFRPEDTHAEFPVDNPDEPIETNDNFQFNSLMPSILKMTWEEVALLPQNVPILSEIPQKLLQQAHQSYLYSLNRIHFFNDELSWKIFHLLPVLVWRKPFESESSQSNFSINSFYAYRSQVDLLVKGQHEELWKKVCAWKVSGGAHTSKPLTEPSLKSKVSRAKYFASKGFAAKAMNALTAVGGIAPKTQDTFEKLKTKHPSAPIDTQFEIHEDQQKARPFSSDVKVDIIELEETIKGFDPLTSSGPSRNSILFLTSCLKVDGNKTLIKELAAVIQLLIQAKVPTKMSRYLAGARLIALLKMKGQVAVDIRPIAIGEMLRRIAAKYLCRVNRKEFLQYLTPTNQLGVGARCGIESIIHAVRLEMEFADSDFVLFQVDFKNAFNNISRRHFLDIVKTDFPDIYNFINFCYGGISDLQWLDYIINSEVGSQQGDPLGPLLFALVLHCFVKVLQQLCHFSLWYLDDISFTVLIYQSGPLLSSILTLNAERKK